MLGAAPAALITDIDGTISRIVSRPEDALVSERAKRSLAALARRLALVAVITAREEGVARRMVGVPELTYVGNYALDEEVLARFDPRALDGLKAAIGPLLAALPCVQLEEKGVAFSLHYRRCKEAGVREELLGRLRPLAAAAGARILEGKQVIELVPQALPDKGTAVARLLERVSARGAVYLGDDLSDIAVFRELARRRQRGRPGLAVAVVDEETDVSVIEAADATVAGVDGAEELLDLLAGRLEQEAPE